MQYVPRYLYFVTGWNHARLNPKLSTSPIARKNQSSWPNQTDNSKRNTKISNHANTMQDAANTTLRSETLRETMCDAIIANGAVWKPSEMYKTFAMTDASNTVQVLVACAMKGIRFTSISCLWWGGTKETGSHMKACAIHSIRFTRMNGLSLGNTKEMGSQMKVCAI